MKSTKASILFVLVVLVFASLPVQAKDHPVTRPFKIVSDLTVIGIDLSDPNYGIPWVGADQGVSSETGNFVSVSKWFNEEVGFGIMYAANGDQIFWVTTVGTTIIFTGGTGRFENVSGGFTATESSDRIVSPGPNGTLSFVYHYEGEGSITY
jgi:hypothetical protein